MRTDRLLKSEPESPAEAKKRTMEAEQLDRQIRLEWKTAKKSIVKMGTLLTQMRDSQLWRYLKGARYRTFNQYAEAVIGEEIGRSRMFEVLAAHGLTEGENPVPNAIVEELGIKKCVQLARLDGSERTDELVKTALKSSLRELKQTVDEKINETLPLSERREIPVLFCRHYPPSLVYRFEELEDRAVYMCGIRDGDTTFSLNAKFMAAMITNFEVNHAGELREANEYKSAKTAAEKRNVISIKQGIEVGEDDEPPEPGEFSDSDER